MRGFGAAKAACILVGVWGALVIPSAAQTFTRLANFDATGSTPGSLVQGLNGNFYGVTSQGGSGYGSIFEVTSTGRLSTLYKFCSQPNCADGEYPTGLVLASNGKFYGTTTGSSVGPYGTVFEITAAGKLTTLYTFCSQANCADGANPYAPPVQANGALYGITSSGGDHVNGQVCTDRGCGTVFKITPAGKFTTIYNFCAQANCTDGADPGHLLLAGNGNLYGTTYIGGTADAGTVFEVSPAGAFNALYSFCAQTGCPDGLEPNALVQAAQGNFFGTTFLGGSGFSNDGTFFKMSPTGNLTTLYWFCANGNCSNGANPNPGIIQGTNGDFYGTTNCGGLGNGCNDFSYGPGTIFEITSSGKLTTLYRFCSQTNCNDGEGPVAGVLQATDGKFYGTTTFGGANGWGTVFRLDLGLGPFVAFVNAYGRVGQTAQILGQNLTGTTSVSFNGVQATSFRVVSATYLTAVVPTGATTGPVVVTTPTGTLTSNRNFTVLK